MLDKEKKTVCDALREFCGEDGVFKVVEADEILDKLPDGAMTKLQLSTIIRDLKERDYIKVKYFTPDEYCLQTLPKLEDVPVPQSIAKSEYDAASATQPVEAVAVATAVTASAQKSAKANNSGKWISFWYSFAGAMLGGGIVAAIAILIQKFA